MGKVNKGAGAIADVIVAGAGPAGTNAALAAAASGLDVVLLDEQDAAGGQVWRKPLDGLNGLPETAELKAGNALRERLIASNVRFLPGRRIWSVSGQYRVDVIGADNPEFFEAPHLIAATGAHERVVPFEGWTLPGVIGLAGATTLIKSGGIVPGNRIVVAGSGPLLTAVAAGILKLGGTVAAVVDIAPLGAWLKALPALASVPSLLAQGAVWTLAIGRARVPVYRGHAVVRALGNGRLEQVVIGPVDAAGAPVAGSDAFTIDADCLCVGNGLVAGSDITRCLRAGHTYDRLRGGVVPVLDDAGRTSRAGLYACGDGYGIRGAAMAESAGVLAGLAAACDAGAISAEEMQRRAAPHRATFAARRRFSDAMAGMMALRPEQVRAIAPETVVCRCEDITRGAIDAAIAAGAKDLNQLKHFTRCGMGPCQARMCGDVVAELLAIGTGDRAALGALTMRPPLRPVPLEALLGDFSYSDIPIPEPAPL
ncbi:MAG: FAD-dependent oxidoreductase [Proteobacteria bacterium]|nr:FAD-dependent oxidoreductase [Pseudomonadota bacterium]